MKMFKLIQTLRNSTIIKKDMSKTIKLVLKETRKDKADSQI